MSNGLNRCTFIGNLAADPELRMTHGGQAVLWISIGCTVVPRQEQHAAGEDGGVSCTWGQARGVASRILEKGKQVYVEGRCRRRATRRTARSATAPRSTSARSFLGGRGRPNRPRRASVAGHPTRQASGRPRRAPPKDDYDFPLPTRTADPVLMSTAEGPGHRKTSAPAGSGVPGGGRGRSVPKAAGGWYAVARSRLPPALLQWAQVHSGPGRDRENQGRRSDGDDRRVHGGHQLTGQRDAALSGM